MTAFFDTNLLVYAVSDDDTRRDRAQAVIAQGGVISVQVLNEFVNVLRKKLRLDWRRIEDALAALQAGFDSVSPLTIETHQAALTLARDHGLSFYDALIVASALDSGCTELLTEDLQNGRRFGRMAIRNPFT